MYPALCVLLHQSSALPEKHQLGSAITREWAVYDSDEVAAAYSKTTGLGI